MVIWSSTITAPRWSMGLSFLTEVFFNILQTWTMVVGLFAIRYLKPRGPMGCRHDLSRLRSQAWLPYPEHWLIHQHASAATSRNRVVFMKHVHWNFHQYRQGVNFHNCIKICIACINLSQLPNCNINTCQSASVKGKKMSCAGSLWLVK